jgi:Trk K+ transport system NAD-binding subunit
MTYKLRRVGADRVVSPFHVAARYTLLTTMYPDLAAFLNYVLYNYYTGLETTEIYMEDESVWIGQTISALQLRQTYNAGVIGLRKADRKTFLYAPRPDYTIQEHEVLIIVTPMEYSDALRDSAYGGTIRRPNTLRSEMMQSARWTPEQIQELLRQNKDL